MTTKSEAFKKEHLHRKKYWQNELESLWLEPKRQNALMIGQSLSHWQNHKTGTLSRLENSS